MNYTLEKTIPMLAPVLPLDGHVLLPAAATPFRVSDPRHRRLIHDLLERPPAERWVAVPPRLPHEDTLEEVASLGLVTVATPLEGGEFIVVVEGRSACRLELVDAPAHPYALPYAVARVRPLVDRPEPIERARHATSSLIQALFALYESFGLAASELPRCEAGLDGGAAHVAGLDDGGIVYRIGSAVIQDAGARSELLRERCPARRREMVLAHIVDQLAFALREGLLGREPSPC